jgi:hypothetical protein
MGNKGVFFFFFLAQNNLERPEMLGYCQIKGKANFTTLKFPRVQFQASISFFWGSVSGYGFHKLMGHLATRNILSRYMSFGDQQFFFKLAFLFLFLLIIFVLVISKI